MELELVEFSFFCLINGGLIVTHKSFSNGKLLLGGIRKPDLVIDVDLPVAVGRPDDDSLEYPNGKLDVGTSHGIDGNFIVEFTFCACGGINNAGNDEKDEVNDKGSENFKPSADSGPGAEPLTPRPSPKVGKEEAKYPPRGERASEIGDG